MLNVATPRLAQEGGVNTTDLVVAFLISVMAGIVCHYICKWLDGDDNGNEPKE